MLSIGKSVEVFSAGTCVHHVKPVQRPLDWPISRIQFDMEMIPDGPEEEEEAKKNHTNLL